MTRRAKSETTSERRRSPRVTADDVLLRTPTLEVTVLNRSRHGLAIETREALRVGAAYRFVAHSDSATTRFEGRVLWCRLERLEPAGEGEVEPVFRAGIRRESRKAETKDQEAEPK